MIQVTKSKGNEFELIARLAKRMAGKLPPGVVGIGDDAAALPIGDQTLLLTCDIAVAGKHFHSPTAKLEDVGWKLATANVSDVVACGGLPEYALISLGVPEDMDADKLEALYDGLNEAAQTYGFHVIGGNVSGASELIVDCFMVGRTSRFVPRSGAQPGHLLALGGRVGDSAAGLEAVLAGKKDDISTSLIARHLRPKARLDCVAFLEQHASAAIDISDSLAAELNHLASASQVALEVNGDQVPVSSELIAYCGGKRDKALSYALRSGEEYQVLCAVPPQAQDEALGAGFVVIGEVSAGAGVMLDGAPLQAEGWDHLAVPRVGKPT